jgi:hypothetical protein
MMKAAVAVPSEGLALGSDVTGSEEAIAVVLVGAAVAVAVGLVLFVDQMAELQPVRKSGQCIRSTNKHTHTHTHTHTQV